jgi:5-formyltetrahydrofolate cyclo-ligase
VPELSVVCKLFPLALLLATMSSLKTLLRSELKTVLQNLDVESVRSQSETVCRKLFELPAVQRSSVICVYLSMSGEVDTSPILRKCFEDGKTVYIPKIVGKQAEDMRMFEVKSMKQIESFPKNRWGIPEPPISLVNIHEEPYLNQIEAVFIPGVAFDRSCGRLGHGKGYYGKMLCFMISFSG